MNNWYVMLFPSRVPESFRSVVGQLERRVGGSLVARPHLTVAYLAGNARPGAIIERLRTISSPVVSIRGSGLFSFWPDSPHPLFGYCLFMHVQKNHALKQLHEKVLGALRGVDVRPLRQWEDTDLHLRLLDHLPISPSEALMRLNHEEWTISFPATHLVLSQVKKDGEFVDWLQLPLGSD